MRFTRSDGLAGLVTVAIVGLIANATHTAFLDVGWWFILVAGSISLYLLPTYIGCKRGVANAGTIFFVNLFLGWTIFVWAICLIWAATGATQAQDDFYRNHATNPKG